jgi:hypothetical protein
MNQPIELQSIGDLSQYIRNTQNYNNKKLYLYVVKKDNVECYEIAGMGTRPVHVAANTIHIGAPVYNGVQISNRAIPYDETMREMKKLANGDFIKLTYDVVHELKPGATRFEDMRNGMMKLRARMVDEVSVFDIGDIGYELNKMTPEQAAEKYFGVSDFRQLFSNYAAASKQMSLKNHPHVRRAPQISLTGMHPVEEVKPPSSFHEYLEAGRQLFSRKHPTRPDASLSRNASALAGAAGGLMLASGRPLSAISAMATMSFPFLRLMHEQKQLNQLERQRSSNERKKLLLLSDEEREKLLAKGALASELTRRLTTTPTPQPRAVQSSLERFKHIHDTVHQKPTSARIHGKGGRKIRRTRKK